MCYTTANLETYCKLPLLNIACDSRYSKNAIVEFVDFLKSFVIFFRIPVLSEDRFFACY